MLADLLSQLTVPTLCASLGLCIFVYILSEWYWFRVRYDWHKIPSTPSWPLVGDLPSFLQFGKGENKFHEYNYYWWRKLGKPKVYKREIVGLRFLIVSDPAFVQNEVTGHHGLPKSSMYNGLRKFLSRTDAGNILVRQTHDEKWKAIRKHVARAFSTENLKKTFPKVLDAAHQLIDKLAKVPAGEAMDIGKMMSLFTFEVISSWGMGVETEAIRTGSAPIFDTSVHTSKEYMRDNANPLRRLAKKWLPFTPVARNANQKLNDLYAATDELYGKMKHNVTPAQEDGYSIASGILDARNSLPQNPFTDDELKSEAIIFFFAGTETTSQQLTWALCCLACNKDVQSKLAQEVVDAGFAGSNAKDLTYDDLRSLPYTNAVIKETMRILPVAATGTSRYIERDSKLFGYRIPANTLVTGPQFTLNRLDSVFKNPDTFDPDRWLGNELPHNQHDPETGVRKLWIFGNGPRDCIGQRLAIMEMQVMLPMLVSKFNVELDERMGGWEGAMARKCDKPTSNCKGGMWLKLSPRT